MEKTTLTLALKKKKLFLRFFGLKMETKKSAYTVGCEILMTNDSSFWADDSSLLGMFVSNRLKGQRTTIIRRPF